MSYHDTEGFSDAIAEGDAAGVRHYVGSQKNTPDISGYRAYKKNYRKLRRRGGWYAFAAYKSWGCGI